MAPLVLPHVRVGEGPHRVIAVHGWFADRGAYAGVLDALDRTAFSYVFPDLRGYGELRDTAGEFTTSEAAADLLALADSLGWERFSLVGHSMGGKVIQRVLTVAPERVRRMVGIAPVPAGALQFNEETRDLFAHADERPDNRRAIIDITTGNRLPAAWLDGMVRESARCSAPKAFRAWFGSWADEDFHDQVEGAELPVRVVVGAHDPELNAEAMRATWLAWYPRAELVELPCAGHYPADETPLELVRAMEDFLRADE
ncbi:alpha/beta fold hydrolase [Streptomyces boncukensis]|uniref:Alpha/beta hydrolase n=1 Tax=Streptomyces boncukensis TaxID=2711219 RepID=A0A6G4X513_9ACTN|nr:alpha/beta hydrolase [Streptomyces boncukensis]NGO72222.1 alpha/beta hydrolase [Streptomyces boncukensis]